MIDKDYISNILDTYSIDLEEELTKLLKEEISKIEPKDWFICNKDGTAMTVEDFLEYTKKL